MAGTNVDCRLSFVLLLFCVSAFAAANLTTEGGNISSANLESSSYPSSWHAAFGTLSGSAFSPLSVSATENNLTSLAIGTGSFSCRYGVRILNLLFSNSSGAISSLSPGNLATLDSFLLRAGQNGTDTFNFSTSFATASFGTISGVPTTYTEPSSPRTFPEGYLQDQSGNLVFITPAANGQAGFNGTPVDFQAMLPTRNGTAVEYHVSVDLACNPRPPPVPPYTVSPGVSIPVYREFPNVTLPLVAPNASDLRILRFSPFREVLPGDNIVINPLIENPTANPVTIKISLLGGGVPIAESVANVLLPAHDKRTVPFAFHIPDDMPAGYYSLTMNISTGKSEVSYPSILRVVRNYRPGQPSVSRQFSLDYENRETLVSLTVTNRGKDPISHLQVYESVPPVFLDKAGNRKFTTELTSVAGEGSSRVEGANIRWDVENVLPYESRTIFYKMPTLLTDLSDYNGWNLAQLTMIDSASQSDILIRDLQVPTLLPGEKGEISMKLFNAGAVAHDVEVDLLEPQGWNINPRSLTLSLSSRGSESEIFEVQSPPFASSGTYGFTLRIKYRDTLFDKQVFVYIYRPVVEVFAPPLPDQFLAWMGGSLPNALVLFLALAIVAGIAFAFYRKANSAAYSQERLNDLRFLGQMLDIGEEKNREKGIDAPILEGGGQASRKENRQGKKSQKPRAGHGKAR